MQAKAVSEQQLTFAAPALAGHSWCAYEIAGAAPGPRLCVMAGMHVNEVAGIAAAQQLIDYFSETSFSGQVAILPVTDPAAIATRAQHCSPVDGRNINFSFPGRPDGSYSAALADALLQHWAADADLLIDLHGGDLCETMTPFAVQQCTGDAVLDQANAAIAEAFDPQVVVQLPPEALEQPGRSCSGRARQGRRAGFFEAGANGLLDAACIRQHVDGVKRAAALLGMIAQAPPRRRPAPLHAAAYRWVAAQHAGWCDYVVEPGAMVTRGHILGCIKDALGRGREVLVAPADGILLWRCTHPLVVPGQALFGIAAELTGER